MQYTKGKFTVVSLDEVEGIDPKAQILYVWLCKYANQDGKCFPSRKLLSQKTGLPIRTVDIKMKLLVEIGKVKKEIRMENNRKLTCNYTIILSTCGVVQLSQTVDKTPQNNNFVKRGSAVAAGGVAQQLQEGSAVAAHRTIYKELNQFNYNGQTLKNPVDNVTTAVKDNVTVVAGGAIDETQRKDNFVKGRVDELKESQPNYYPTIAHQPEPQREKASCPRPLEQKTYISSGRWEALGEILKLKKYALCQSSNSLVEKISPYLLQKNAIYGLKVSNQTPIGTISLQENACSLKTS